MVGDRAQLYKIRRLVRDRETNQEYYEYVSAFREPIDMYEDVKWAPLRMDGFAFVNLREAVRICERLKVTCDDPCALYHSVVPA